jgi:hypothetical protein
MLVTFRTITGIIRRVHAGSQDGFTLIEALMAAVILVVGLIGLLGLLDASVKASATTRAREGATGLAREIIEDARTIPYAQIIPNTIESRLRTMPVEGTPPTYPLADGSSAPGWQIERRGFSYTVKVEECAIDDPKDGLGQHPVDQFCNDPGEGEGTADSQPEDLKRITAEVSWTFQGRTSTVKQVSTLTAAGQAIGLVARELRLVEPPDSYNKISTAPVITEAATALTFSVSFPEGTKKIIWSLEGAKQGEFEPAGNATSHPFSWTITNVSDGTYQVAAQAEDATRIIGPPISIPVRLIRGIPAAPSKIMGGFNTVYNGVKTKEVTELQWEANAERNVIGYRVYDPIHKLVCPFESTETLSTSTSCIDGLASKTTPPEGVYTVVALYRNAGEEVTESPRGEINVTRTASIAIAPNPPINPVLTKNTDGSVTLKWEAPQPKSGVKLAFYRIYRGSTDYTSRYGETTSTAFIDTDVATPTPKYWVTAVSSTLTESTPPSELVPK